MKKKKAKNPEDYETHLEEFKKPKKKKPANNLK